MSAQYYESMKEFELLRLKTYIDAYNVIIAPLQKRHNEFLELLSDPRDWPHAAIDKGNDWVYINKWQLDDARRRLAGLHHQYEEATKRYNHLINIAKKNSNAE